MCVYLSGYISVVENYSRKQHRFRVYLVNLMQKAKQSDTEIGQNHCECSYLVETGIQLPGDSSSIFIC